MFDNYQNIDVEQIVLCGLLHRNHAMTDVDLGPDDFYYPQHGDIFLEMRRLLAEKRSFSLQDMALWAQGKTFADLPAYDYLRLIADMYPPDSMALAENARTLKELSRKRKLYTLIHEAQNSLLHQTSAEIQALLTNGVKETTTTEAIKTCAEIRKDILENIDMPANRYKTGLECLDIGMGGGLYQGFTYGICGAEKAGKTTLAHTISFNLDCKHLYIAMEMGARQIEQRNISRQIGVNSLKFLNDGKSLKNSVETAKTSDNVYYLDLPGGTLDEILYQVGVCILKHGIKGFILDYWQLVEGKAPAESEERHLRNVAQGLANFARKNGVWCIILAQMNKDGGLFGGNGIRKACDQLYMIEFCEPQIHKTARWLRMDASRYTFKSDIGSATDPALMMNNNVGPFFENAKFETGNDY
jgi:replicative DNA helicase